MSSNPWEHGKVMVSIAADGPYHPQHWLNTHYTQPVSQIYKYSLLMHCIKIKSPVISLSNEQYVFVGGNIYFLCVLSCSSEEA